MLWFARDLPNLCSLTGLLATTLGLFFAVRGTYPAAVIALLWAVVFDWADGLIARRMRGRTADQAAFGAQLDSLIDIVSFSVAPALLLLSVGGFRPLVHPRGVRDPGHRGHSAQLLQRLRPGRRLDLPGVGPGQQRPGPGAAVPLRARRRTHHVRRRPLRCPDGAGRLQRRPDQDTQTRRAVVLRRHRSTPSCSPRSSAGSWPSQALLGPSPAAK